MKEPRWYRENGNVYFADIGREGSLVWVEEATWHTDEVCEDMFQKVLTPSSRYENFKWVEVK